ncbi:hypothetical protein Dimus_022019 [Dionaea muscipula]
MTTTSVEFPTPIILLFLLCLLPSPATLAEDLASDGAALLAFRLALHGITLPWNTSFSPCSWPYVGCQSSRVTELHLPGRSLSGSIPEGILSNLTALTFLSLRFNSLTGSIPSDIASCSQLQYVYLQGNRFSGEIPGSLLGLSNLIRLDLADNDFSGEIPGEFNRLSGLATLSLENNNLTGKIPNLNLPGLQLFNVSNNLLSGSIPKRLAGFPASAFTGNSLCGSPLSSCTGKKKLSGGAIAGIVIAALVALIVLLLLIFLLCCRKRKEEKEKEKEERAVDAVTAKGRDVEAAAGNGVSGKDGKAADVEQEGVLAAGKGAAGKGIDKTLVFFGSTPKDYDLDSLLRASAEVLGNGLYGTTYKATLDVGVAVAVKRLKDVTVSEEEFKVKMEEIGRMNHENLVSLKAYHCSPKEKLLVYEYMPRGSLSALLHGTRGGGRTPLSWETRSMIALGAARGVAYIHSQGPTTAHGNIKSSNVLLSSSYEARVSDFGLAQIATPSSLPNRSTGYRAPEVTDTQKVSKKADVYSFGVFVLELLTGKPPAAQTPVNEEGVDLPRWVQSVVREEWASEVFDVELLRYHQNLEEEMVQLLQLAIDCTAQHPDTRPSMEEITSRIEQTCRSASSPVSDIVSSDADTFQSP